MRAGLRLLTIWFVALAAPALAQNPYAPALTVNDSVITRYDIEQRVLLLDALGAAGDLREQAVTQLTEDRLKLQAGEELGIELPEGAVAAGLEEFATTRGLTLDDVLQVLDSSGIDRQTMDDFVEAGIMWREVVGTRFRARATPTEAELDAALELERTQPREMIQLAEVALPFAERGEAETQAFAERLSRELQRGGDFAAAARQYSRSATAAQGGNLEPMPANRLPPALRTQVLLLAPGQVTRPVPISGGVAILKVVSIREVRPDPNAPPPDAAAREQARQALFAERINSFGQGYLQELLSDALIVER
jgi:peptidyl-prolyl cis-trans isomerase SurA